LFCLRADASEYFNPDFPLGIASAAGRFERIFRAILYRPIPDTPRYADKNATKTASQIASTSLRALMENLGSKTSAILLPNRGVA
jgi:hypothetical protein